MTEPIKPELSLDVFGIKAVVEGAVDLVKARFMPIMSAQGEARAKLIELRGQFEYEKEKNQLQVVNKAETKLRARNQIPVPVQPDVLLPLLDGASLSSTDELQELWAELLANAATEAVTQQRVSVYTNVIRQLTQSDAQLLQELASHNPKQFSEEEAGPLYLMIDWPSKCVQSSITRYSSSYESQTIVKHGEDEYLKGIEFTLLNLSRLGIFDLMIATPDPSFTAHSHYHVVVTLFGKNLLSALGLSPIVGRRSPVGTVSVIRSSSTA